MPKATLSAIDMGKGVGFWNTMPTRERSSFTSMESERMSRPSSNTSPLARWSG
jgi:hypothetical protein